MKWKSLLKCLNLLKILVYYSKELVKQFKMIKEFIIKEQKRRVLSMLLGTLGAILLSNTLAGKGMNRAGEEFLRAGYGSSIKNKDF